MDIVAPYVTLPLYFATYSQSHLYGYLKLEL